MGIKGDSSRVKDKDKFNRNFDAIYKRFYCPACQNAFNGFVDTRCEQCNGIPYEIGGIDGQEEIEELIKTLKEKGN